MKRIHLSLPLALIGCTGIFLASCQTQDSLDQVVSQTFVHKYGFNLSEQEWEQMSKEGQVVSTLKNGVKVASSYENSQLHGPTTDTFPYSSVIEKSLLRSRNAPQRDPLRSIGTAGAGRGL